MPPGDTPGWMILLNGSLFLLGYFIPSFLVLFRQRDARLKVFLVNLLAGWTLIGWMVAFIWAVTLPWDFGRRRPAAGAAPQVGRRGD